jgi:uncharacterized protein YmfQ (DUF2313 family)
MGSTNVAMSAAQYRDMMLSLLPQGAAWPRDPNSNWGKLFYGFGEEFARVDASNDALIAEMDVRTALELLPDYETDYGLPGQCIHEVQTLLDRRNALVTKYRLIGRQDRQFFIDVAADLGYAITITEYDEAHPGPQPDYNGIPLSGDAWNYVWQINAALVNLQLRTFPSSFAGPFGSFGNELLECTLRGLAHDHRALFFSYT